MSSQKKPENEPEKFQSPVPSQKRTALLRYIEVLFAAAFMLVILSLLFQLRDSNLTISQVAQSSATTLAKADSLQENNRELREQLAEAQNAAAELQERRLALEEENRTLRNAYDALLVVLTSKTRDSNYSEAVATVRAYRAYYSDAEWALFEAHLITSAG